MGLDDLRPWCDRALALGAGAATPMRAQDVVVADWVRMKCLYGCDDSGAYRTCPPNAPPVEQIRRVVGEFERAILLEAGADRRRREERRRVSAPQ